MMLELSARGLTLRDPASSWGTIVATGDTFNPQLAHLGGTRWAVAYFTLAGQVPETVEIVIVDMSTADLVDFSQPIEGDPMPDRTEEILIAIGVLSTKIERDIAALDTNTRASFTLVAQSLQAIVTAAKAERPIEMRIFGQTVRGKVGGA